LKCVTWRQEARHANVLNTWFPRVPDNPNNAYTDSDHDDQGGEHAEKREEQTVPPKKLLRRKSQNGRQVKAKKHENVPGLERRRGKHARHGRAQESKDKSAEQSISHDARVCLARIETGYSSEVQWPKRHAKNSGKHASWKKDAEWFPA